MYLSLWKQLLFDLLVFLIKMMYISEGVAFVKIHQRVSIFIGMPSFLTCWKTILS